MPFLKLAIKNNFNEKNILKYISHKFQIKREGPSVEFYNILHTYYNKRGGEGRRTFLTHKKKEDIKK